MSKLVTTPHLSPDGLWWWSGDEWFRVSQDKKLFWNGRQWQELQSTTATPAMWEVSDDDTHGYDGQNWIPIMAMTGDKQFWTADPPGAERNWHPTIKNGVRRPALESCPPIPAAAYLGAGAGNISSPYGANRAKSDGTWHGVPDDQSLTDPISEIRAHMGVDYESVVDGVVKSLPFYSPVSGTVIRAGDAADKSSFNRISVRLDDGRILEFLHAARVDVKIGQPIVAGRTVLGVTGDTGAKGHIHLHVQARDGNTGLPINPNCIRPQIPAPVQQPVRPQHLVLSTAIKAVIGFAGLFAVLLIASAVLPAILRGGGITGGPFDGQYSVQEPGPPCSDGTPGSAPITLDGMVVSNGQVLNTHGSDAAIDSSGAATLHMESGGEVEDASLQFTSDGQVTGTWASSYFNRSCRGTLSGSKN